MGMAAAQSLPNWGTTETNWHPNCPWGSRISLLGPKCFSWSRCLRPCGWAHLEGSDLRVHIPKGHCEGGFCKKEAPGKNYFQFPSRLEDSHLPHSKGGSELGRELDEMAVGPNLFPSWERLRGGLEPDCQTVTGNPFFRYTST